MKEERKGRGTFRTISLPAPLVDAVEKVIKELQYWPTKTDFIRESVIEKLEMYKEELETKKIIGERQTHLIMVGCLLRP